MRRQSLIYTAPDIGFLTVTDNLNRTYQYVTSSNTGIDGVITGLTLNPFKIKEIIGVLKSLHDSGRRGTPTYRTAQRARG